MRAHTLHRGWTLISAAIAFGAVAVAVILLAGTGAAPAGAQDPVPLSATQKAAVLTTGAKVDVTARLGFSADAAAASAVAAEIAPAIPLPKHGTFADLDWAAAGGVSRADIQGVLEYNALCDWERAISEAPAVTNEMLDVIRTVSLWPTFRDSVRAQPLGAIVGGLETGDLGPLRAHMRGNCVF